MNNGSGVDSEISVAVSPDGRNILVANNNVDLSFSTDGGETFTTNALALPFANRGDPSVAVGASGAFYYAFLGLPVGPTAPGGVQGCTISLAASSSPSQPFNFNFRSHAALSPLNTQNSPDHEYLAADTVNRSRNGGDQLYLTWRQFRSSQQVNACNQIRRGFTQATMTCSADSGNTWLAPTLISGSGDFARVTVGQDGSVYVIYRTAGTILLDKFSSCDSGLVRQRGFPVRAFRFRFRFPFQDLPDFLINPIDPLCPVPGLDRCSRRLLSSHMLAVDDTNPNHIYAAFSLGDDLGNDTIVVADSRDGGRTWRDPVQVSAPIDGRKFMPWVCATGGTAYVSWYDRRDATRASNDITDFFIASASLDEQGELVAGPELEISEVSDDHCASGWPVRPGSRNDSEFCSVQPQLAGRCRDNSPAPDSNLPCDFSDGGCPSGESCRTGGGRPKYGDYNTSACADGRLFVAWASATSPPGITPASADIDVFFDAVNVQKPIADANGPYLTVEGVNTRLDGRASRDPNGDSLSYAWHLGSFFGEARGPTPAFTRVGQDGEIRVQLRVADPDGFSDVAESSVTITNAPPR